MSNKNFRIEEVKNENIKLRLPVFICDNVLKGHDHEIQYPAPRHHFYMVYSGTAGSGKTSCALAMLKNKKLYKGVFDNVVVIMPYNSLKSLKSNPFKKLDPEKVFHDLNEEVLQRVFQMVSEWSDDGENTLLFIDDMAAELKNKETRKLFNMLIQNRRHLRVSIMMCVQRLNAIPLDNRKLISHIIQFAIANKKEWTNVYDELIFQPKEVMEEVKKLCFKNKKKGDFLYIDVEKNKLYNKFNRLNIISNDISNGKGKIQIPKSGEKSQKEREGCPCPEKKEEEKSGTS